MADVEFALLEPTGKINVLPKTENQPLTAKDLNIKLAPEKEPQTVIMDGRDATRTISQSEFKSSLAGNRTRKIKCDD